MQNRIDQKHAMQLIGEWGFTPAELEQRLKHERHRAKEIGETVGITAYNSLINLCRYASSGDASGSIRQKELAEVAPEAADMIRSIGQEPLSAEEIKNDPDFAPEVLTAIYNVCSSSKTFDEAMIALRYMVMINVAPFAIKHIAEISSRVAGQLLECIVGAEHTLSYSDNKVEAEDKLRYVSNAMESFTKKLLAYTDKIQSCKETEHERFNELANHLIGDMPVVISDCTQNMLSLVDKDPLEWANHCVQFGRLVGGFILAMSFGYITYEDYVEAIENFRIACTQMNQDISSEIGNINFGRN